MKSFVSKDNLELYNDTLGTEFETALSMRVWERENIKDKAIDMSKLSDEVKDAMETDLSGYLEDSNGSVKTGNIRAGAVTNEKLADYSITFDKINTSALMTQAQVDTLISEIFG